MREMSRPTATPGYTTPCEFFVTLSLVLQLALELSTDEIKIYALFSPFEGAGPHKRIPNVKVPYSNSHSGVFSLYYLPTY